MAGRRAVTVKLHYHPFSTYSRRVVIALIEKQIPHELVAVDMMARKHREEPYLSLNPYGRVPTLEEDGFVLYESTPILNYLEATRPTPALAPADPGQKNPSRTFPDQQVRRFTAAPDAPAAA